MKSGESFIFLFPVSFFLSNFSVTRHAETLGLSTSASHIVFIIRTKPAAAAAVDIFIILF